MGRMLASRLAGLRLGLIVALLLVPVIYFGSVLLLGAMRELALARAGAAGMRLMDVTFNVMVDINDGWSASDHADSLIADGGNLATAAGVTPEYDALAKVLSASEVNKEAALSAAASLMQAIGTGAAVNDPGNREANILAGTGSQVLPRILLNYRQLSSMAQDSMMDPDMAKEKLPQLAEGISELAYHAREFEAGVLGARTLSADPEGYSRLLGTSPKLNFNSSYFRILLYGKGEDHAAAVRDLASALLSQHGEWDRHFLDLWADIRDRLDNLNAARFSALKRWAISVFAVAGLTVALGLGTALNMALKTLRKLDEVEAAQRESNAARLLAEQGARELAAVNDNLAKANSEVLHHLRSLEEAQAQLIRKNRMEQMGQLTATMAHELRNPLGSARTSLFLVERKTKGKGLGIEAQLQRITTAIIRCDNIITQLLDFSRSKNLSPTEADLDSWLEKAVAEHAERLPQEITITCNLGLGGLRVAFDPARLQRALVNLLNNASEALAPAVADREHTKTRPPQIEIISSVMGEDVRISVADNGVGVAPENLSRIREPLFTTKSFGTGLGLPAVEQILAQHGGRLDVSSTLGEGTVVTMHLPIHSAAEEAA